MSLRKLWLLPLVMLLSSCATAPVMKDTAALPPGIGIMVANVFVWSVGGVAYPPVSIKVDKLHGFSSATTLNLPQRSNLIVIELPAGDYSWTDLELGSVAGGSTSYRMPFTIEPGKINYVGDLLLTLNSFHKPGGMPTFGFRVGDQSQRWLPVVASRYPLLAHAYPTVIHLTEDHMVPNQNR
ncbi:hypothetical protein IHE49_14540 [Rhodanobacter sp. 7MK24]|uniref:hypothetical protein n=1 Tax=Rhodanobacter sp. 7MK24 TaxID=2775922 RepID=UPI00177CF5EB|nr:hypothetical protein [Rhodanobacter sp. 7MK24]MBD8881701.1 hypothetical protein [Rhodanobacter sp. 7MK24]